MMGPACAWSRNPVRVVLVLAASACGATETKPTANVVRDSAGVQLVSNPGPAAAVDLVEDLRIGVVEGEEAYQFFQVGNVDVHGSGDIYVTNRGTSTIRVFSAEGQFLREFGGRGGGPGEFQMLSSVTVSGDTVLALDFMGGATIFTTDGEYLTRWPRSRPESGSVTPVGRLGPTWMATYRPPTASNSPIPVGLWVDTIRYHRFDPSDGSVGEEVVTFPRRAMLMGSRGGASAGPLFDPVPAAAGDDSGRIYVTAGGVYRIDVTDMSGKLVKRISREHERRPILDEWTTDFADRVRSLPSGRDEEMERIIDRRTSGIRSTHLPPTGRLLVADDGAFWVERVDLSQDPGLEAFYESFGRAGEPGPPTTWDIFDTRGFYTATVEMPETFTPSHVTGTSVMGVLSDGLDVQYVVRFEVLTVRQGTN